MAYTRYSIYAVARKNASGQVNVDAEERGFSARSQHRPNPDHPKKCTHISGARGLDEK